MIMPASKQPAVSITKSLRKCCRGVALIDGHDGGGGRGWLSLSLSLPPAVATTTTTTFTPLFSSSASLWYFFMDYLCVAGTDGSGGGGGGHYHHSFAVPFAISSFSNIFRTIFTPYYIVISHFFSYFFSHILVLSSRSTIILFFFCASYLLIFCCSHPLSPPSPLCLSPSPFLSLPLLPAVPSLTLAYSVPVSAGVWLALVQRFASPCPSLPLPPCWNSLASFLPL